MEDLQLSYYHIATPSISIHHTDQRIIFSTRSGRIMTIRSDDYDKLSEGHIKDLPSRFIQDLKECELLVDKNDDELDIILKENIEAIKNDTTLDIVIQPGASCQLGCHYCGQNHTKQYMTDMTQANMLDRISSKLIANGSRALAVTWYGAEPLMAVQRIRDQSKQLIDFTKSKNIQYSAQMITNGLSLKKKLFFELVEECKVSNFQITLDGTAEYHDKNRYTKGQKHPTFDLIFKNILDIVFSDGYDTCGGRITIRCNIDRNNEEGVESFIQLLRAHNIQDKIEFYVIPVHNWGDNKSGDTVGVDQMYFAKKEIDWLIMLINNGFETRPVPTSRVKIVCSAVKQDSEVYDAYGTVSTCWEVPYTPLYENTQYEIGSVNKNFKEKTGTPMRDWNNDIREGKSWCKSCKLLPVCGGSCPIHWNYGIPACPSFKFNIEDRLLLEYVKSNISHEQVDY